MDEILTLEFKIPYHSYNDIFLPLIKRVADSTNVNGYVERKDRSIVIIAQGNEDNIKEFSDKLGEKLPFSIFMEESQISLKDNEEIYKDFIIKNDHLNILPLNLGLCRTCNLELFDKQNRRYMYPFISCNYCGPNYSFVFHYPYERENTIFRYFELCDKCKEESQSKESLRYRYPLISCYNCFIPIKYIKEEITGFNSNFVLKIFDKLSDDVINCEEVLIKTLNGFKKLSKSYMKNSTVIINNPTKITEFFYLSTKELNLLASIEKPTLKIQVRQEFKETQNYKLNYALVKFPDDPILLILSYFLSEKGLDFIYIKDFHQMLENKYIDFDIDIQNVQKDIKMYTAQNRYIIYSGDKGIIPSIIKTVKDIKKGFIYGNFGAIRIDKNEYLIDRKDKILTLKEHFPDIPLQENNNEPYKLATYSVIAENNLFDENLISIYLSYDKESVISVKKGKLKNVITILPIKKYLNIQNTINNIFKDISNYSENYTKLVEKYKKIFNLNYNQNETDKVQLGYGIGEILDTMANILFIEDIKSLALDYKSGRALKVDFELQQIDDNFYINWKPALASLMAYKLAGDGSDILAFSIVEGFAEFLEETVNKIASKFSIEKVILTGDYLSNTVLTGRLLKHLNRYDIYINKLLPTGDESLAFGGIFID